MQIGTLEPAYMYTWTCTQQGPRLHLTIKNVLPVTIGPIQHTGAKYAYKYESMFVIPGR